MIYLPIKDKGRRQEERREINEEGEKGKEEVEEEEEIEESIQHNRTKPTKQEQWNWRNGINKRIHALAWETKTAERNPTEQSWGLHGMKKRLKPGTA